MRSRRPPQRIVGTWTDTVLHQGGKKPQRGFGGRLIFYGEDAEKPVLVDGQLVVYAFDESNREPTDNKPTRRYVFPPDQVARRMSKIGARARRTVSGCRGTKSGGPQTEISLIARFEPKEGAIVVGEQTKHLLAGRDRRRRGIANNTPPKLAGRNSDAAGDADVGRRWPSRRRRTAAQSGAIGKLRSGTPQEQSAATAAGAARAADDDDVDFAAGEFPRAGGGARHRRGTGAKSTMPSNVLAEPQAPPPNYGVGRRADQLSAR